MAFQLPSGGIPNFNVTPPQIPNPLEQYGKMLQLRMLAGQQAMLPYQMEQEQEKTRQAEIQTAMDELKLQTIQGVNNYWKNPAQFEPTDEEANQPLTTRGRTFQPDQLSALIGVQPGDPIMRQIRGMMKANVPFPGAIAEAQNTLKFRQSYAQMSADQQKVLDASLTHLQTLAAPILNEKDANKKQALLDDAMPSLMEWAKFDPSINLEGLNAGNFDAFANRVAAEQKAAELGKAQAEKTTAEHQADPLYKYETDPSELGKPGAAVAIQALINDPNTPPEIVARARPLLADAKVAGEAEITRKRREAEADQAARQGDPSQAGRLLADYSLTLQELKTRGATPQFIQQAITAAQKFNPTFKAPTAEGYAEVAHSAQNQQFFGNTDSLLTKGGTLDQLAEVGKTLPQGQLPPLNTIADWTKARLGKGPIAAYAAAVLGVADDYAKVMGGAQGSDTARQQVLDLFKASQSPEQRNDAIQQVRQQVVSQRRGRVGSNPYLQNMYPEPGNADRKTKSNDPFAQFGGQAR